MFRVVCIIIFTFNTYHNSVCKAEQSKSVDIGKVIDTFRRYVSTGASTLFNEKTKKTFKEDILRHIEHGYNVMYPQREYRVDDYRRRLQHTTYVPMRKYKKVKPKQSTMRLIQSEGYKAEAHKIPTYDGYILTVHRIPSLKKNYHESVILHHGILGSSEDWLLLGAGKSLPYLLSDQGYDVWLLNARGNKYSVAHEKMDVSSFDFWDFSWHEMGVYDLPAVITYIHHLAPGTNLYYIGHSMGGTALLVLLSTFPEYNQKIKMAILLAPLAFMANAKGPLKYYHYYRDEETSNTKTDKKEFIANYAFPSSIVDRYCRGSQATCANALLLLCDGGKEINDPELKLNILGHVPAGSSSKTMTHYMQLIRSGNFQMFDYGTLNNLKRYNNEYPPQYNLSAITLPIDVFTSNSDWLATTPDVATLLNNVKSAGVHDVLENYEHYDFVWAPDAVYMLYYVIIDIIDDNAIRRKNVLVTTMI